MSYIQLHILGKITAVTIDDSVVGGFEYDICAWMVRDGYARLEQLRNRHLHDRVGGHPIGVKILNNVLVIKVGECEITFPLVNNKVHTNGVRLSKTMSEMYRYYIQSGY